MMRAAAMTLGLVAAGCHFELQGLQIDEADLAAGPDLAAPPDLTLPKADFAGVDLTGPRPNGAPCMQASQCASGFCADGTCCQSDCSAQCMRCDDASGKCIATAAGEDPRGECPAEAKSTCGRSGGCDGKGACTRWPDGTACAASSCNGDTRIDHGCSGGACVVQPPADCSPYSCDPTQGACYTSCTSAAQCAQSSKGCTGSNFCH
jgi:hypothetical protein